MLLQPRRLLFLDAGLGRLHLGRVGLGEEGDQLVLVRSLPVLEIGLLSQGLEVADLHGRDPIVEELLLEGDFLDVCLEEFLGQSGSPSEPRFCFLNGGQEVCVSRRLLGHDYLRGRLLEGVFLFLECFFLGVLDRFLLGLLGQFLAGGILQGLDELLLVLEGADVVFLLGRDEEGLARDFRVVHTRLQLVQQLDHVLLGHVEGDALGLVHLHELGHRQVLQPARCRDLLQLLCQLLDLLQGGLLLRQELDQLVLGT